MKRSVLRVHGVIAQRDYLAMNSVIILTMIVIRALMKTLSGVVTTLVDLVLSSAQMVFGLAVMHQKTAIVQLNKALIHSSVVLVVNAHACALLLSGVSGVSVKWVVNVCPAIMKMDHVANVA